MTSWARPGAATAWAGGSEPAIAPDSVGKASVTPVPVTTSHAAYTTYGVRVPLADSPSSPQPTNAKASAMVASSPIRRARRPACRVPAMTGTVSGMIPRPVSRTLNPLPYCRNDALT
jgi:hypothetical protein